MIWKRFATTPDETENLLRRLFEISDGTQPGETEAIVYYADWEIESLRSWDTDRQVLYANPADPDMVNAAANELDTFIEERADRLLSPSGYIAIIGGDEITPFYRIKDPTPPSWGSYEGH